jgi:hypothetical protein
MSQTDYKKMSESEKKKEDWMNSKWRPAMGWIYMVTCSCDFILFPVLWSVLQTMTGATVTQWNPITLQGAGLYHLAMGAVLGVAAWSRGQEKMAGVAGGPPGSGTPGMTPGFGSSPYGGMPATSSSYSPAPSYPAPAAPVAPTNPPRQLSAKSKRIIPDNDLDDADYRPKSDPEARG